MNESLKSYFLPSVKEKKRKASVVLLVIYRGRWKLGPSNLRRWRCCWRENRVPTTTSTTILKSSYGVDAEEQSRAIFWVLIKKSEGVYLVLESDQTNACGVTTSSTTTNDSTKLMKMFFPLPNPQFFSWGTKNLSCALLSVSKVGTLKINFNSLIFHKHHLLVLQLLFYCQKSLSLRSCLLSMNFTKGKMFFITWI